MIYNLFFSLFFFTRKGPQKRVKENMLQTTRTNKQNKVLKRLRPVSWRRNKVRAPQNWASHPICNLLAPLPTWAKERLNFAAKNFISFTDEMQSQKGRAPSWQQRMTSWLSPSMVTSRTPALAQNIQASWIARHSAEKKTRHYSSCQTIPPPYLSYISNHTTNGCSCPFNCSIAVNFWTVNRRRIPASFTLNRRRITTWAWIRQDL